jgi:predicted DNA-binding transcriptional regulator AlpA
MTPNTSDKKPVAVAGRGGKRGLIYPHVPRAADSVCCTKNSWDTAGGGSKGRTLIQSDADALKELKMSAPIDLLIRDRVAAVMLGCSATTFWRRVADGTIPRPVKIGGMSRWPTSEIEAVVESAKARRND